MDDTSLRVTAIPLRHRVVEAIRSAIISGRFEPGQRLVEKDLCELLGVSRVSIREALRQLEAEGFIDTVPHRGPVVIQLTSADVRNLYDVLSILEAQAARLFTQNATDDEVDAFEGSVKDIARTYKKGSVDDRLAAKTRFYDVMFAGAHNPVLESLFRTVFGRISIVLRIALASSKQLEDIAKNLQKLANTVRKRDPDKAFELSRRYVESAAVGTLRCLLDARQIGSGSLAGHKRTTGNKKAARMNTPEAGRLTSSRRRSRNAGASGEPSSATKLL